MAGTYLPAFFRSTGMESMFILPDSPISEKMLTMECFNLLLCVATGCR